VPRMPCSQERGTVLRTDIHDLRTTVREWTAWPCVYWGRYISSQQDAGASPFSGRVWNWHGREKRLSVRVERFPVELVRRCYLHDRAELHDDDAVAKIRDHSQVVGNKQVGESKFIL